MLWYPRGTAGVLLLVILLALVLVIAVALSAVLLVAGIVAAFALAAYQGVRSGLAGRRERTRDLPIIEGRFRHSNDPPLERYINLVEEFDGLTSQCLELDAVDGASWRGGRRISRLHRRAIGLRLQVIEVERAVSSDRGAEAARPGLWELIVAATELQHYLEALLEFPSGRGRAAQARELVSLQTRRTDVEQRRNALIRRLQDVDLRSRPQAAGT